MLDHKCMMPFAVNVAKSARCLFDQLGRDRFFAVIVLKKKVVQCQKELGDETLIAEIQENLILKKEECIQQFAVAAVKSARYHFCQQEEDQHIAKIVMIKG